MNRKMYLLSLVAVLLLGCVSIGFSLQITSVSRDAASGEVILEWDGRAGGSFAVSRSDAATTDWVDLADGLSSMTYTDATAQADSAWYRVEEESSDQLRITGIAPTTNGMVITWDGGPSNSTYTVSRSEVDLENWLVIATGLDALVYTDEMASADFAYYKVETLEGPPPPAVYFQDDLETGGVPGWSNTVDMSGTDWEIGTPSNVGPTGANSGDLTYGTNIDGDYTFLADVSLFTPVIDLTTATNASLSFAHWFQGDGIGDFYRVLVKDATGATNLMVSPLIGHSNVEQTTWTNLTAELPADVLGQEIRLEFRFDSDFFDEAAGWYIDDIVVKEPEAEE